MVRSMDTIAFSKGKPAARLDAIPLKAKVLTGACLGGDWGDSLLPGTGIRLRGREAWRVSHGGCSWPGPDPKEGGGVYGPQNCCTEQCALSAPEAPEILF